LPCPACLVAGAEQGDAPLFVAAFVRRQAWTALRLDGEGQVRRGFLEVLHALVTLLAVPALLSRVDLEAPRSSPTTGAVHPEARLHHTSGTANKPSRATSKAARVGATK